MSLKICFLALITFFVTKIVVSERVDMTSAYSGSSAFDLEYMKVTDIFKSIFFVILVVSH